MLPMHYQYDAIIELGYRFEEKWLFSQHLKDSITLTADLYKNHTAPLIITCGKWSLAFDQMNIIPPFTEASEMKKQLITLGVPDAAVLVEEESKDTIGNAYYVKIKYVQPRKLKSLLVVCAEFHASRVEYIFKRIYGKEYTIDIKMVPTPHDTALEQLQKDLLAKQQMFLSAMQDGEDTYLKDKLYTHGFFRQ